MSHEVENMFSVNETPWHGLGRQLIDAPDIERAIIAAGLDWNVSLESLYMDPGPNKGIWQQVTHRAVKRCSDNRVLGVVGPQYMPLQNKDAFKWFSPFVDSGLVTLETAGSLRNGARVWILAKINQEDLIINDQANDRIRKYILLSNTHDGTMSIRAGFTPIRVVCANTLSLAHGSGGLIRIKHTAGAMVTLDAIRDIMSLANQRFDATAEQFKYLASRQLVDGDLKKYVNTVFDVNDQSRLHDTVRVLNIRGRGADQTGIRNTWWTAYNAVTEYLQHERGNSADTRLNSAWFGQGATLGNKAFKTALKLAS